MRQLDGTLGLSAIASMTLRDNRPGKNKVHPLEGMFRQALFSRLAGYEDINGADHPALDPVMRQVVGGRAVASRAASASQMGRFETEMLSTPENMEALAGLCSQFIDRFHDRKGWPTRIVLDMDNSDSPTHGDQEGAAWNGHFGCKAIIQFSCSTSTACWSAAPCATATSTAPMVGRSCLGRCSTAARSAILKTATSALTLHSPQKREAMAGRADGVAMDSGPA